MGVLRASGPAGALFRAVNTIDLKEEQKGTFEKMAADLREAERAARDTADGGRPRNEVREAHAELVSEVKAGKIDAAKMESHYAAIEAAANARQARDADALNRVHAALEPSQRTAVVASVRKTEGERAERMKRLERPDAGPPNFVKLRLERYMRDLALDPDQKKKVEALIPKDNRSVTAREEERKRLEALLAAFEKDDFDAKKIDLGAAKVARGQIEDQVKLYGQLLPILKPEQREKLAKDLERTGEQVRPHRGMGTSERILGHDHDEGEGDEH